MDRIRRVASAEAATAAVPSEATPAADDVDEEDVMLEPGDAVPDLNLRLETGEDVTLSQWRGSAVAMTFFFTRCPLPDFCPRMNNNFEKARSLLMQNDAGPTNWVFLSLSFDSDFDQPKVLQTHATIYRGTDARGWWFAAMSPDGVEVVKPAFDLMVGREGGSFSHNLRTVVVDPAGRVFRQFNGNRWTPEELAEAMTEASRGERVQAPEAPVR
jgi:protein SCO1/2